MAEIRLQEGESLENALRRFKRKVQSEDIIKEVKRHSYYLKPGEKRLGAKARAEKDSQRRLIWNRCAAREQVISYQRLKAEPEAIRQDEAARLGAG